MQQALLVDHPSMENASYNQVAALHLKCHTLNIDARLLFLKKPSDNQPNYTWSDIISCGFVAFLCPEHLPSARLPLCECPPCESHQVEGKCVCIHPLCRGPQSLLGWRVGSHRPAMPRNHGSPAVTDKTKNNETCISNHSVVVVGFSPINGLFLPTVSTWNQNCIARTWKWGCVRILASSAAVLERCLNGSRSLRISCRSSTLFSLTGDRWTSFKLSSCSWHMQQTRVMKLICTHMSTCS